MIEMSKKCQRSNKTLRHNHCNIWRSQTVHSH